MRAAVTTTGHFPETVFFQHVTLLLVYLPVQELP
jgi:hypothetical protein